MKSSKPIKLGYAVGSGDVVDLPLRHMMVTGQTQEAGKTTTLEALIARSGLRAVTFVTKRGEGSFKDAARIAPYFREQADWQFVASILEASRGEKLKFERAWIIRASRGATTLKQVQANVQKAMETAKGMSADVYLTLDAYLEAVVPQIQTVKWATSVKLSPGVNAMDLSGLNVEMQHLVIRSTLDWVLNKEHDTVVVVPEAWKFIPQGRGTPVKLGAEAYIRQGASLRNYLWLDSQDIAGVDKMILKSCPVWLLGVQRESNEVKRTLEQIPAGVKKPRPADIQQLGLGQFFACWGMTVAKTYVQPAWMSDDDASAIARGAAETPPPVASEAKTFFLNESHELPSAAVPDPEPEREVDVSSNMDETNRLLRQLLERQGGTAGGVPVSSPAGADEDAIYQRFKARLMKESPALVRALVEQPELEVKIERHTIEVEGTSLPGRIARLIARGWLDESRTNSEIVTELGRTGGKTIAPRVSEALAKLKGMGFVTDEGNGWQAVKEMKRSIKDN